MTIYNRLFGVSKKDLPVINGVKNPDYVPVVWDAPYFPIDFGTYNPESFTQSDKDEDDYEDVEDDFDYEDYEDDYDYEEGLYYEE